MPSPRVIIAYWADAQLSFVPMAQRLCDAAGVEFAFHQITHHPTWFGPRRSLLNNVLHLSTLFLAVVRSGRGATVCAFGTNACRGLYPFAWMFRRFVCVYNELPEHRAGSWLRWWDRLIFLRVRDVYVSTTERAEYVRESYGLDRTIGVVQNIAFEMCPENPAGVRENTVVFAGSITPKRFSPDDLTKFARLVEALHKPITVYGFVARELSPRFECLLDHKGTLPHADLLRRLTHYRFALLAYYQGEPNYELCAPLKLYEYVAAGCTVVSINRNQGLLRVAERYPNLLLFVDDLAGRPPERDDDSFLVEREAFLREAWTSNRRLAEDLLA